MVFTAEQATRRERAHVTWSLGPKNLHAIECHAFHDCSTVNPARHQLPQVPAPPMLYVLNASSIAKPHAIEQFSADMMAYDVDIGVVKETDTPRKEA
jgi:hypothetical protein